MGITASLRFWLALYENRPIYHRQSTDIPPTVNGQRMAETRPLYRPIVGQNVNRQAADAAADISADMSTDISRSIYRPSVGRYVDRHIGRVSVNISADTSVHYRSICRPIVRSRGAQNTPDPKNFNTCIKITLFLLLWCQWPIPCWFKKSHKQDCIIYYLPDWYLLPHVWLLSQHLHDLVPQLLNVIYLPLLLWKEIRYILTLILWLYKIEISLQGRCRYIVFCEQVQIWCNKQEAMWREQASQQARKKVCSDLCEINFHH